MLRGFSRAQLFTVAVNGKSTAAKIDNDPGALEESNPLGAYSAVVCPRDGVVARPAPTLQSLVVSISIRAEHEIRRGEDMTSINAIKWSNRPRPSNVGASATLPVQLPIFGQLFPEVLGSHPATINLYLEQPLLVQGYDHRTPPISWQNDGSAPEVFDLVRVKLEVRGVRHDAWLYFAHGSPHRQQPAIHEFIARERLPLQDDEQCVLHISRPCTTIPNGNRPVVVIT